MSGQWVVRLALAALAFYALVVLLAFVFQREMLFHPFGRITSPAAAGLPDMQEVVVRTEDGLDLVGWYAPPARDGGPVVVVLHGNAGHIGMRAFRARPFMAAGYGVWLVGYRGYGGNPGSPSEQGLYADARAVLDHLAAEGVPPQRLVLYGESLGTGVAVQMAVERPVAALVLEAPFTSIPEVAQRIYPFLPTLLARDRFENLAKIGEVRSPLLIVHGERDGLVPVEMSRRLYAAGREPKQAIFLPHARHHNVFRGEVVEAVLRFLEALPLSAEAR